MKKYVMYSGCKQISGIYDSPLACARALEPIVKGIPEAINCIKVFMVESDAVANLEHGQGIFIPHVDVMIRALNEK